LIEDQEDQAQAWFENLSMIEQEALSREVERELDGIILARSGLERSGLASDIEFQYLPKDEFTPSPGQGALAITASDDDVITEIKRALDHPRTRVETTVERTILKEVGGGCIAPIGIHAYMKGDVIHVNAVILDQSGDTELRVTREIDVDKYESESLEIADELVDKGGKQLIERAKQQ
ncbi:MAG: porphobilinogen deaminase, partial [Halobacteriaceae archaeon]